jgi:hypothetical protein
MKPGTKRATVESITARYAVTARPGYFGSQARIYSAHKTLEAARKQLRKSGYTDERHQRRLPCCIVEVGEGYAKGDILWGDMFPKVVE